VVALLLAAPWALTHYLRAPQVAQTNAGGAGVVIVQPPQTIAVLPLIDMSPDRSNAYLGDGLAQELAARLARSTIPTCATTPLSRRWSSATRPRHWTP
jgi:TolB-like protein